MQRFKSTVQREMKLTSACKVTHAVKGMFVSVSEICTVKFNALFQHKNMTERAALKF